MHYAHCVPHLLARTIGRVLLALAMLAAIPAAAQPAAGSIHREFLPLGSGSSVPLPEGSWEVARSDTYLVGPTQWQFHILRNQSANSSVPVMIVRHTTTTGQWGNTGCQAQQSTHFMVNEHGTRPSELLNKCSRFFALPDPRTWGEAIAKNANPPFRNWWMPVLPGLSEVLATLNTPSALLGEMRVQQTNNRIVQVEALIYPPPGMRSSEFRRRFVEGTPAPEHDILGSWASIYIEAIQKSFLDKKPQAILPLAMGPVPQRLGGPTLVAAATPAPAAPAPAALAPPPAAPTPAPARVNPPVAAVPAPALAAPAPAPAPVIAQAPAPAAAAAANNAAAAAERERIERERRALEQERQQVNQQLEAMRQMLAKLQQENAAAAKAQEARATAAAAAPAAPPAPAAPVVFANRKALVIGNDNYTHVSKLMNAVADAEAMSKSLEAVGYKVTKHVNLDERRFKQVLRDFRQNVQGGDEVLFFFAGHGVQLGNANYLLPVDIRGDGEDQVKDESILLQKILDEFDEKKAKFTLAVIDACRDNPFKSSKGRAIGGRGLAPTSAATGQMVMFSAGAGQQALDRLGDNDKERNGLFTRIFVREMTKPGVSVDRVLRNVRNEVVRLAKSVGHEQTPALYDQAIGEFFFKQ